MNEEMTVDVLLDALKRSMPRIQIEMEEIHGRASAEIDAIDSQIDLILSNAGVLDGIRALEARRTGVRETTREALAAKQQALEDKATSVRVFTHLLNARQVGPSIISIGGPKAA